MKGTNYNRHYPTTQHKITLHFATSPLFETFFIGYAGSFKPKESKSKYVLIASENFTGSPLAVPTTHATSEIVQHLIKSEILLPFEAKKKIISHNTSRFTSVAMVRSGKRHTINPRLNICADVKR